MARRRHVYVVGGWAFLPHPEVRGAWLRTSDAVLLAGCRYCGARKGQPCRGKTPSGFTAGTHVDRRQRANALRRRAVRAAERRTTLLHVLA